MDRESYELYLQRQEDGKKQKNAVENIKDFISNNDDICNRALNYYNDYITNYERYLDKPVRISAEQLKQYIKNTSVLVLTATSIENGVFLHWLYDKSSAPLITLQIDGLYYHVCNTSTISIVHVHTEKTGEEFTRRTLNRVRRVFRPDYIFMLGICFGFTDMRRYPIGSVFASDSIRSYRLNFREEYGSDEVVFQAEEEYYKSPSDNLIQLIQGCWRHRQTRSILPNLPRVHIARTEVGKFLSSNCLMDSRKVKNAVLDQFGTMTKPLGGEMEGAGILKSYLVEEDGFADWMVIKSICDWGEKKNSIVSDPNESERIKKSLQAFAMSNTCGAFENILTVL